MAQKTTITIVCDLPEHSGEEVQAEETISFGFGGQDFDIDVCQPHGNEFREAFGPLLVHGRRISRNATARQRTVKKGVPSPREIRQWAADQGLQVNSHGRIPADILDRYEAANR